MEITFVYVELSTKRVIFSYLQTHEDFVATLLYKENVMIFTTVQCSYNNEDL